ncbi:MAG TPA: NADH-quinone oxidoreductase subunit J, partial [Acidobacteria bacterium]|nr:NADH-quinone oxidoreductase subunit J [Acidobacteriota bacterium]
VLFLFVIMLLNIGREDSQIAGHKAQLFFALLGAVSFGSLVILALSSLRPKVLAPLTPELVSLKALASTLFNEFLLPFEIIGLLLTVAVIGATVAARRPTAEESAATAAERSIETKEARP